MFAKLWSIAKKWLVFAGAAVGSFVVLFFVLGFAGLYESDGLLSDIAVIATLVLPVILGWLVTRKKYGKLLPMEKKEKPQNRKPLYKRWWVWAIAMILLLGSCGDTETAEDVIPAETTILEQATEAAGETAPSETIAETTTETTTPETAPAETVSETVAETTIPVTIPTEAPTEPMQVIVQNSYVLNTNSMKFHRPSCSSAQKIGADNRRDYTGTRDEVISMGYDSCGRCHP